MYPLYFYLLLGSLSIPLLFSVFFIDFIKHWKNFILSTSIIAFVFLIWDAIFTLKGVWAFEHSYTLGIYIIKMPIEEWLFFFIIPFCSLFTHFAFVYKFPESKLSEKTTKFITVLFLVVSLVLLLSNIDKAYTFVNFTFLSITLFVGFFCDINLLQRFYISFLIVLIPFFIVNGVLTGVLTDIPVVSYNDSENLGIRITTVPVEDIGYAFSMLFCNLLIFNNLNKKS